MYNKHREAYPTIFGRRFVGGAPRPRSYPRDDSVRTRPDGVTRALLAHVSSAGSPWSALWAFANSAANIRTAAGSSGGSAEVRGSIAAATSNRRKQEQVWRAESPPQAGCLPHKFAIRGGAHPRPRTSMRVRPDASKPGERPRRECRQPAHRPRDRMAARRTEATGGSESRQTPRALRPAVRT
jgi:hypothetical protein